jgi:methylmalonyl-CoA mutase N-terminal domain/subunit
MPAALLQGGFGYDPLGALARDGRAPYGLDTARELAVELAKLVERRAPQLRSLVVDTTPYHDAGASGGLELAIALGTALTYLRWLIEAGVAPARASAQLEFRVGVAGDLFGELAKLRALRVGYAKLIAALGGDDASQQTRVHAVTARRTDLRDPWEHAAYDHRGLLGDGRRRDSLTTRGFDEVMAPRTVCVAHRAQRADHPERRGTSRRRILLAAATTSRPPPTHWRARPAAPPEAQRPAVARTLQAGSIQREIAEVAGKRAGDRQARTTSWV